MTLATVEETRLGKAAGAITPDQATIKGKLVEFAWSLKKDGVKEASAKTYVYYLEKLTKHGANLLEPETVKETLASLDWDINTKALAAGAYSKFLEMVGGVWKRPKYKKERTLPFIPLEKELDQLTGGARKKMATFLQLLKETGMRSGEAWRLKWIDVDIERRIITLNKPEKNGVPRTFKVSPTLTAMLNTLRKESDYPFNGSLILYRRTFRKFRNRMAFKLQNPRLKAITFHTFRHWKATMEYHKTKDLIYVQQLLGHRDIKTTMLYTQLVNFESDNFHSAVAKTVDEATKLIEAGFEYVCSFENTMLYRKRK